MSGQTLSELRRILDERGLRPRHRLGQNFLIDLNLMRKLVALGQVRPDDTVLEVGAGTGSLTELLLETGARVVAVELDDGLAGVLRERIGDSPRLELLTADVLAAKHALNPAVLEALRRAAPRGGEVLKLVANLPFSVATPLLMELLCGERRFDRMACTVQREVADRLTAAPGSADYGPVSVLAQSLARVRRVAVLPPAAFWPRPKVDSAMLVMLPLAKAETGLTDVHAFAALVRRAFLHRRQMLRRIVARWNDAAAVNAALRACGIDARRRPQELPPGQWRLLHRALADRATP